ncbi:MAG: type I 3-dehydroquinate dehydratase, partial [Planctomycetota bacterium]
LPAAADLVELRLDRLPGPWDEPRLGAWIDAAPRPVIATVRGAAEGGGWTGSVWGAARVLEAAARAGAAWIDVEAATAPAIRDLPPSVRILASCHDGPPGRALPSRVAGREVDAFKRAHRVGDAASLARLREVARNPASRPSTVVPYGPLAALRSALVGDASSWLFGSAGDPGAVVAGQPPLVALLDDLRAGEVDDREGDLSLYGLLGRPPARSPSPALHNAAFRHLGREALYLPLPGLTLAAALELPFEGFSVTTPFKEEALAAGCQEADPRARAVGAANTLVRTARGGWRALNTDAEAVAASVPPGEGGGAFVYGTGGFARAAAFALSDRGYAVRIGARGADAGRRLARAGGWPFAGDRLEARADDRVLVNATPAGAGGEPVPALALPSYAGWTVLDAPYRRGRAPTGLVAAARPTADRVVDGHALLLEQARGQVRAFCGVAAPDDVLRLALVPPLPLLLLGLRGAGKTAVGRAVASRLGRPFLDLDDEVARITGHPPAWWIKRRGEEAFRAVEVDALSRLAGRRGVVVGAGGALLEPRGAAALVREHTWPLWIEVSPSTAAERVRRDAARRPALETAGGALDPEAEARRLLERRRPAWAALARHVVAGERSVEHVAEDVARAWAAGAIRPS